MNIPFVDLDTQYLQIKEEVQEAINNVLESKKFIQGELEKTFSRNWSKTHGCNYAVGCSNGTSAITVALRCLGIGLGDEVITVANSFFATPEAIVEVGATPIFVDCDPETYLIDCKQIESKINSSTKAIIPVHLYGNTCAMNLIAQIAERNKLHIIEDCAQAHLARFNDVAVGTYGDFGTFSFYPGKNLGAYGDAGLIISQDEERIQLAAKHINHGRQDKYLHEFCAGNYRMDGLQAAILDVKLRYIEEWTRFRIENATYYDQRLKQENFKVICKEHNGECVYHLYVVEVSNRDEVMIHLKSKGISCGIHYPTPLHLQPALEYLGYCKGAFPVSERAAGRIISLPIFPELKREQIDTICDAFLEVAKK